MFFAPSLLTCPIPKTNTPHVTVSMPEYQLVEYVTLNDNVRD
jgi:hypothetical protein